MSELGNCTKCGRDAKWNTPYLAPDGDLLCNACAGDSPVLLRGISQFRDEQGQYVRERAYTKRGVCIRWYDSGLYCWVGNGVTCFDCNKAQRDALDDGRIEQVLDSIADFVLTHFRCTDCKGDFPRTDIAGRPLFAGLVCAPCKKKHEAFLEGQRKSGKICRRCREPYGNCCC